MGVAIRSRNQRSWLITTTQPGKDSRPASSARSVSTSRSLVGSSRSSPFPPARSRSPGGPHVAAGLEQLREVDAVPLATRQLADEFLLVGAPEVERRDIGAGRDLAV